MEKHENNISVSVNGKVRRVQPGSKLSSVLNIDFPCGGHGKCGKCKVKAEGMLSELCDAEKKHLTEPEIESGIRLACKTFILGDCHVQTLEKSSTDSKILADGTMSDFTLNPAFSSYGAAIDIGTTTIAASLYNTSGTILAQSSMLNPQSVFGADVVSRIEAALKGENNALAQSIAKALDETICDLAKKTSIKPDEIDSVAVTGNTVMLYLLTNTSTEPLSHAPFITQELFGKEFTAQSIGLTAINADTKVYLPNCISAFVGADTVCALIATGMCEKSETRLLADIGTNGEIALWHHGELTVASTAAGPAFEGVGISMGMRGETGAIDSVALKNGEFSAHVLGDCEPCGICGSGLIDAIACMLDTGVLDETGYLEDESVAISGPVYITDRDVRMVQLAKGAIHAGINTVIKSNGITYSDISCLHIAGGFGSYLNMESAARIGLIPKELTKKVNVAGNAALSGACMLLLNRDLRKTAKQIASHAKVLELSSNPLFTDEYMEQMMF